MSLVLSPLNPIFHIAKASVIPEQIFEPIVDAEGHCLNCNGEIIIDEIIPPNPTPVPCLSPAFDSAISVILPCPIVPGPGKDLINAEAVDEDIVLPPTPTPVPCPTPIASIDSIIFPTPILIQPCPAPAIDPVEEEEEEQITPPGPPAGGGGGGGISIFKTNVLGTTPPTTTDQQVLGEQVFSDGTPTQQVLGEQKFASVLGEKVTAPSFPKTGSATSTTNSILWQLSLTFLLSAALIVSLNQKKTVIASK